LLARLDGDPEGWRRCAMAFLQQQAWRGAMQNLARGLPPKGRDIHTPAEFSQVICRDVELSGRNTARLAPWCALAAALLVAFGLGALSQLGLSIHLAQPRSLIQARGALAGSGAGQTRPGPPDRARSPRVLASPDVSSTSDGPAPASRDDALASPGRLLEALRQSGHQVHRQRGFVPFSSEDGRAGWIPVEDLYVLPANYRTY
jgi:hypothetical protein